MEVDHFCPPGHDGTDALDNLVYACTICNRFKSDYWPIAASSHPFGANSSPSALRQALGLSLRCELSRTLGRTLKTQPHEPPASVLPLSPNMSTMNSTGLVQFQAFRRKVIIKPTLLELTNSDLVLVLWGSGRRRWAH